MALAATEEARHTASLRLQKTPTSLSHACVDQTEYVHVVVQFPSFLWAPLVCLNFLETTPELS